MKHVKGKLFEMNSQKRVLFLSPHPDDHLMCAGLLLILRKSGWELGEILFTDGSRGGNEDIRKRRSGEYEKACELLKIQKIYNFGFVNRSSWESSFQIDNLIDIYQEFCPTILLLPNPLDYHYEHRIVAKLGMEALLSSNIYKKQKRIPIVLFVNGFLPSEAQLLINISDVYGEKKKIAETYTEELYPHVKQWMEAESLYFGTFIFDKRKPKTIRAEAYSIPKEWPADLSSLII